MDPALLTVLIILVQVCTALVGTVNLYLLGRMFGLFKAFSNTNDKPIEVKVQASSPEDNSYTKWAAEAQATGVERAAAISAKALVDVAKIEATTAADNRAAEEARLQRAQLEQASVPLDQR